MNQKINIKSPGRINIIGDHTDYHDGFVLPAAIDKNIAVKLWQNGDASKCKITAKNFDDSFEFDLTNYQLIQNSWPNYIMGVVSEMQQLGLKFQGFNAEFSGDIPIGSGLSSSAALECAFAFALNEMFEGGLDREQLVRLSQKAENNFVGMNCGIMDQFSSMMGRKNQVMLLDCRSLELEYFPLNLGDYQILLLNSNVAHSLADSAYNERREQSEKGVEIMRQKYPDICNLRDVNLEMLFNFKHILSPLIYQRCYHVITENQRVLDATKALKVGNLIKLGELMYASHQSLQNDYEVSCEEVDFLVERTISNPHILGSRMMGGGFGGCTINIIKKEMVGTFVASIKKDYQTKWGLELTPYQVSIEEGTHISS